MGTIAHPIGVTVANILKEAYRPSVNIPEAMSEVLWEVGAHCWGEKGQMYVDTPFSYHRLRFTLVPQTLATWGIWGHAVFLR